MGPNNYRLSCKVLRLRFNTNYHRFCHSTSNLLDLIYLFLKLEVFQYTTIYINSTNLNYLTYLGFWGLYYNNSLI